MKTQSYLNFSYVNSETNEIILYLPPAFANQRIGTPIITLNHPNLLLTNITNQNDLKNVKKKRIPIILAMKCLNSGNITIKLIIPDIQKTNITYTFVKQCFSPNIDLNIYSEKPKNIKDIGNMVKNNLLTNSKKNPKDFEFIVKENQYNFSFYIVAKNITKNEYYNLMIIQSSFKYQLIGEAIIQKNQFKIDKYHFSDQFNIDFKCFESGSFITKFLIEVKGYKKYYFMIKKTCVIEKNEFIKSKFFVWMFLGSIFMVLFLLALKDNLKCYSTKEEEEPAIQPNETAIRLLYNMKFKE